MPTGILQNPIFLLIGLWRREVVVVKWLLPHQRMSAKELHRSMATVELARPHEGECFSLPCDQAAVLPVQAVGALGSLHRPGRDVNTGLALDG